MAAAARRAADAGTEAGAPSKRPRAAAARTADDVLDDLAATARDLEDAQRDKARYEAIADDYNRTPEDRVRANMRLDTVIDTIKSFASMRNSLRDEWTALSAFGKPPGHPAAVGPAGDDAASGNYQACLEFYRETAALAPAPTSTASDGERALRERSVATHARSQLLLEVHGFAAEVGSLEAGDVAFNALASAFETLRTATDVQSAVDGLLKGVLSLCREYISAFVLRVTGTGGLMTHLERAGYPHPQDHGVYSMVGNSMVGNVPTPLLLVESKIDGTIDDPWDSIGKFIRDMEFAAVFSEKAHVPGVIISQNRVYPFELFRHGMGILVLKFTAMDTTNDWRRVTKMLMHAVINGTFLGAAEKGADTDPYRFVSFLGRGATSVVFETASPDWPVAKVFLNSQSNGPSLARYEVAQINKLFESPAVQNLDHFLDATLDPTRQPRARAPPNPTRQPRTRAESLDPTRPPRARADSTEQPESQEPPGSARSTAHPILFYSRRCQPFDMSRLIWSHEAFQDTLRQLLDACRQMHLAGIVHNDVRESNLMLTMDGATLILGDFGFSRAIGGDAHQWAGGTTVTASPHLLRKLEMTGGANAAATPEDDLWSVATLCLHAEDSYARSASRGIVRRYGLLDSNLATEVSRMWLVWGGFDPRRYGAVHALLDPVRIASRKKAGVNEDLNERLFDVLSLEPRAPSLVRRLGRS